RREPGSTAPSRPVERRGSAHLREVVRGAYLRRPPLRLAVPRSFPEPPSALVLDEGVREPGQGPAPPSGPQGEACACGLGLTGAGDRGTEAPPSPPWSDP